jgi:O-antigen/teichoic acid export membrane protein
MIAGNGKGSGIVLFMKRLSRDILFGSANGDIDLARKSIRGGMAAVTAQSAQFLLRIPGTLVLARILSPADYGLIAMAMIVMNFVQMFKDAGLSMATVQQETVFHKQVSTLFWLNALISALIAIAVFLGAPLLSLFFNRPELTPVTAALAVSIFISGLAIQHEALLRRHMRFQALAFTQIIALLVNLIVSIVLALSGFRYWALVIGMIAHSVTETLLAFYFCPWMPGKMQKGTGVRGMLKFGGHLTGFNFVNYFARNADNILVGKFIGMEALGLYSKAYQMLMLPLNYIRQPLDQVALPALSALRNEPGRYARYYERLLQVSALAIIPLTLFCALEADFLVKILLGPQWIGTVTVFRILALAGLVQSVAKTRGLVLISHGYSVRYFYWGLINAILTVFSFIVGLPFGIEGVAIAYTIANYVILLPSLAYCFHGTPVTIALFFRASLPPLLTTMPAIAVIMLVKKLHPGDAIFWHGLFFCIFFGSYLFFSWRRRSVRDAIKLIIGGLQSDTDEKMKNGVGR